MVAEVTTDFKKAMKGVKAIGDLSRDNRGSAVEPTVKRGYEYGKRIGRIPQNESLREFKTREGSYNLAQEYMAKEQRQLIRDASNGLDGNLETIVGDLDDSKLEGLIGTEQLARAEGSAHKDYAKVAELYIVHQNAKELLRQAKNGGLGKNEREAIIQTIAQEESDNAAAQARAEGYELDIQQDRAELARKGVLSGLTEVDFKKYAAQAAAKTERALITYEEEHDIRAADYVRSALVNYARKGVNEFNEVLELTAGIPERKADIVGTIGRPAQYSKAA